MNGSSRSACPPGGDDAASWVFRGMTCTRRRQYNEAVVAFERALHLNATMVEAMVGMGNAFFALERYDDALQAYDRALAVAPERPALHLARSNALEALGRCNEAHQAYDCALALRCRSHQ
ncbi:Tetratricopeptide repeat protein [anaerobic digester metagenome]